MFGSYHYVPILRWKRAEKVALKHLLSEDKARITPLIELIPSNFKPGKDSEEGDPEEMLDQHAAEIRKNWGANPFFLELTHVEGSISRLPGGTHPLEYLGSRAQVEGIRLIPVTALGRREEYQTAVSRIAEDSGACFRVMPHEVVSTGFASKIAELARRLNLRSSKVDIVVDYHVFDASAPGIATLIQQIPNLSEWRTLTVACGAFPQDLQKFAPGRHMIDRADWVSWRNQIHGTRQLQRRPSFGDYTVQYGVYVEPPARSNPSASIRYTLSERWLIMRGEGIFNEDGPGHAQYGANATLLCDSDDFYGQGFSYGDGYIFDVSQGIRNHGNPETWIRAGINHHLTVVARQLANLDGS